MSPTNWHVWAEFLRRLPSVERAAWWLERIANEELGAACDVVDDHWDALEPIEQRALVWLHDQALVASLGQSLRRAR